MVDIAGQVPARRAVDAPSAVDGEHVSGAARLAPLGLWGRDAHPAVGRDIAAALDRLGGEQAEAGGAAADTGRACGHGRQLSAEYRAVIGKIRLARRLTLPQ